MKRCPHVPSLSSQRPHETGIPIPPTFHRGKLSTEAPGRPTLTRAGAAGRPSGTRTHPRLRTHGKEQPRQGHTTSRPRPRGPADGTGCCWALRGPCRAAGGLWSPGNETLGGRRGRSLRLHPRSASSAQPTEPASPQGPRVPVGDQTPRDSVRVCEAASRPRQPRHTRLTTALRAQGLPAPVG